MMLSPNSSRDGALMLPYTLLCLCIFGACVILCVSVSLSIQPSRRCTNVALYAKSAISAHCGQNLCSLWPKWASIRLTFAKRKCETKAPCAKIKVHPSYIHYGSLLKLVLSPKKDVAEKDSCRLLLLHQSRQQKQRNYCWWK